CVDGVKDHSNGDVMDNSPSTDTDVLGRSEGYVLGIEIIDTAPEAEPDTAKIDEDAVDPAEGNVLDNDDLGADDPHTVEFDGIVPGDTHTGEYGTFTYNEDGTWIYTLDNTDPRVQGLKDDEILTESFDYTVTDADGDSSTATLTITIKGQTDAPPVIDIEDADLDATDAHNSVVEGTGDTVTGEISVSADAGIADVTVGRHGILDL